MSNVDPLDDELDELMMSAMEDCTGILRRADGPSTMSTQPELVDGFDRDAGRTWIYPTNKEVRDYQFNIVRKALLQNTLVCLPTGLGKTFIAAVLMYNFYRWFPRGKVIFMAPTKPLVAQQMEACYEVMGIPQVHMSEMTGTMSPNIREIAWREKRVFFLTPQIISNDISRDICPAHLVCCVVVDEAHKALGNHAYVQVIQELSKHSGARFRVLALSATPGSAYHQVRQVIQNLLVANVEIRGEDSEDIVRYTHTRSIEKVVVALSDELEEAKRRFLDIVTVYVDRLHQLNCLTRRNPDQISKFFLLKERERFRQNPPDSLSRMQMGVIEGDFAIAISLFHALDLLLFYGLHSFFVYWQELLHGEKGQPRTRYELQHNVTFCMLMDGLKSRFSYDQKKQSPSTTTTISPPIKFDNYSHPKFQKMEEIVLKHFTEKDGDTTVETRIIVFVQYRESVREIESVLNRHRPRVRPIILLGQGNSSGSGVTIQQTGGLKQKAQLQVMTKFRSGEFNVLVSTCIGEEGLDIGDVDLIICFDAQKSPVRLVQRMGRTGRKRSGRVVVLMTKGKEEQTHNQGQYNSKAISRTMASKSTNYEMYANNPRMIPGDLEPVCHKMYLQCGTFLHGKTASTKTPSGVGIKNRLKSIAETPYLTDTQLAEWKSRYWVPLKDQKRFVWITRTQSLSEVNTIEPHPETQTTGRILSLSEWLPWQNTLQPTFAIGHSKRTELLVDTIKSLEDLQFQDGTQCELDMASHLNINDVLLPGEQQNLFGNSVVVDYGAKKTGSGVDPCQTSRIRAKRKASLAFSVDEDIELSPRHKKEIEKDLDDFKDISTNLNKRKNGSEDIIIYDELLPDDVKLLDDFCKIIKVQGSQEKFEFSTLKFQRRYEAVKAPPSPAAFLFLDTIDSDFFKKIEQSTKEVFNNRSLFKTPTAIGHPRMVTSTPKIPGPLVPQETANESLYSMTQLMDMIDHDSINQVSTTPLNVNYKRKSTFLTSNNNRDLEVIPPSPKRLSPNDANSEIIPPSPERTPSSRTKYFSKPLTAIRSVASVLSTTTITVTSPSVTRTSINEVTAIAPAKTVSPVESLRQLSSSSDESLKLKRRAPFGKLRRRRLLELEDSDSDSNKTKSPKQKILKSSLLTRAFLDNEAVLSSESDAVSPDESSDEGSCFQQSFIDDLTTQGDQTMYLRSVKSPLCRPGAFKMVGANNNEGMRRNFDVHSQPISSEDSDYQNDSFCVANDDDGTEIESKRRTRAAFVDNNVTTSSDNSSISIVAQVPIKKLQTATTIVSTASSVITQTPTISRLVTPTTSSYPLPEVIILVDGQEIASSQSIISELRLKHKARVIVVQLGSCDYALSSRVAVERKTYSDIANAALRKKLLERVRDMTANFQRWVLIVEIENRDTKSVQTVLNKYTANTISCLIQTTAGRVIFTNSKEHSAKVMYELAASEARAGYFINYPVDADNLATFQFYKKLASNNYVAALSLLAAFSTPNNLLQSSADVISDRCKWPIEKADTIHRDIHRIFNMNNN